MNFGESEEFSRWREQHLCSFINHHDPVRFTTDRQAPDRFKAPVRNFRFVCLGD